MTSRIYMFDVDGTLTDPRKPIDNDFGNFFERFCDNHMVYLVSGSDFPKLEEQLPKSILAKARGVFCCSAAELWADGNAIYRLDHEFPKLLIEALDDFVSLSDYPSRFGNHIEFRTGMLNVSVVGRKADRAARKAYFEWDQREGERRKFIERFVETFSDYEASAGGEISIDVAPKGWNKSKALSVVKQDHPGHPITFFGDRMGPGGNDYPLAEALRADSPNHDIVSVDGFLETWRHLSLSTIPVTRLYRYAS
ncbi:MAG: HAD-IIB family hydrolase [Pseudomonadota bacterium]